MFSSVYATEPGWEDRLIGELVRVFPGSRNAVVAPGWVRSESDDEGLANDPIPRDLRGDESIGIMPCVAFASQMLPAASKIEAGSISDWVRTAGDWLLEAMRDHEGPWRLHVFSLYFPDAPVSSGRCQLIADQLHQLLRKKQRRLIRTEQPASGPWVVGEALVQIALVGADHGFCSACLPPLGWRLRRTISPFLGGQVEIPPDRAAPSRAFAKLLEAERRIDRPIAAGETCVDLGSSPGSWAYVALSRGARVIAVDRSPLRSDLMANPRLKFYRGDAFQYEPPEPVDWLLCDVIAAPERSVALLDHWLQRRWCRHFCVTIKFRGAEDDGQLEPLKARLAATGSEFLLRRLTNNKNEVTAMGTLF